MNRLAVVTWRLPRARLEAIEAAKRDTEAPEGAFRLATCQRVLLAGASDEPAAWADARADEAGVPAPERHLGPEAFRHLARVASSLDAIVPGEDQVPAQVREAVGQQADGLDPAVHRALQRALAVARTVRDEAGFAGAEPVSLADRVAPLVDRAEQVAVVGTGQIARATLDRLDDADVAHVVSREEARARQASPEGARSWTREAFLEAAPSTDALILCTRAPEGPVVDREAAARLAREPGRLTVVDLGVPRNVAPRADRLPGVDLVDVEDLARRPPATADDALADARDALEAALARERRRWARRQLDDRIVALRDALAENLDALADELPADPPGDELDRWLDRAHARLAHVAQTHLEDAVGGRSP